MAEHAWRAWRFEIPERGGVIAALEFGPAERPVDVIFSHANGFNARTYRSLLAPLAGDLRIIAPDLRGHGASTLPAAPQHWPGWNGFAVDLAALIEHVATAPVVLAGHSLGATASLLAAVHRPSRVRALALFEPVLLGAEARGSMRDSPLATATLRRRTTFPNRDAAITNYRARGPLANIGEDALADYVAAGFRDRPEGGVELICRPDWEAHTYAVHDYDPQALAQISCPARILAAERDSTFAAEHRALAVQHGVSVEAPPGTSHFLPLERPDLARQAIRAAAGTPQ